MRTHRRYRACVYTSNINNDNNKNIIKPKVYHGLKFSPIFIIILVNVGILQKFHILENEDNL